MTIEGALSQLIVKTNSNPKFDMDDLNKIPWDILEMEPTSNEAWIVFKDLFFFSC